MKPRKFQFEMGGFGRDIYSLEWDGTQLVRYDWETPCIPALADSGVNIQPSAEQWENFETGLQEIGAYDWKGDYSDETVLDGEYVEIWITFRRRIKCTCYHLEPPNFESFLGLLEALTKNQ